MTIVLLVLATLIAAAIDIRQRRIPNALTVPLACIGIALHVPQGLHAVLLAAAAMVAAVIVGSCAFSAGWFGGGDVKLIAACCAFVGFPESITLVLEVLIAGGVLSAVALALRRRVGIVSVPYGIAIAGGTVSYALSTVIPALRLSL